MYSIVLALIDNPDLTFICDSPIYILLSFLFIFWISFYFLIFSAFILV